VLVECRPSSGKPVLIREEECMPNFHVIAGAQGRLAHPVIRKISVSDLRDVLARGFADFWAKPSHLLFLGLIYVIVGIFLARWTSGTETFQLVYPLMSGFALIGPFAAVGLYEISRRRELGLDASWSHAFNVLKSPAVPSIAAVGGLLVALFLIWLYIANSIFMWLYGADRPTSFTAFLADVFTTRRGWELILVGNTAGFVLALVALCTTVIAFPLLVDRDVGAACAIETSARAFTVNPLPMIAWGLIVAVALVIGSVPLFVGLAIVMPVLGHATWHLYRKVVEPA
jgi:uncharacterized membrane protein